MLREKQVIEIYKSDGSNIEIAKKFGLDCQQVHGIRSGKNYSYITKNLKKGETVHGCSKLTIEQIKEIYTSDYRTAILVTEYGVSDSTIEKIKNDMSHTNITKNLTKGSHKMKKTSKKEKVKTIQDREIILNDVVYIGEAKFIIESISDAGITLTNTNQAVPIGYDTELFQQIRWVSNKLPNDEKPSLYSKIKVGDKLWHSMCGWCEVSKKQGSMIYLKYKGTEIKVTADGKVSEQAKTIVAFMSLEDYTKYHLETLLESE